MVADHRLDDASSINAHCESLPHVRIRQRALSGIPGEDDDTAPGERAKLHILQALHLRGSPLCCA